MMMFVFWLILTPFVVWQGRYEGPKVVWFFLGGIFLCLFWLKKLWKNPTGLVLKKSDYFYLIWLGLLIISSFLGIDPLASILGGSYRHQGVLFFFALWLVGKTITILSPSQKSSLQKGIALVVVIEAVLVFVSPLGTLGEANAVAGFLAIGSFFLISFKPLLLPVVFLAILATGSKIGLFCFVVALFPLVKKNYRNFFLIILLISALAVGYQSLGKKARILFVPKTLLWQVEQEDRVLIWRLALNKIRQRPLLGWGAESSEKVFDQAYREVDMPLLGMMVDRAHNLFLDIILWSGVCGLVFFGAWLFFQKSFSLLTFLAFAFFQPLGVVHWLLLMILLANGSQKDGSNYRRYRPGRKLSGRAFA